MTRRLTKEELDEQFEQFLKESVSDDSMDLGGSEKQTGATASHKTSQRPKVSWWEDDDDEDSSKEKTKCRFIKAPKLQTENTEVMNSKPVPKPRSSSLPQVDNPLKTDQHVSQNMPQSSLDQAPSNTQEAAADEHSSIPHEASPPPSPDCNSQGNSDNGFGGSGKSFLKSLRKSQTIREEEEEGAIDLSTDVSKQGNTETQGSALGPALTLLGMDTLEEEEEKARFFAELEAGASSTIDYSKLNKELDSTSSTVGPGLGIIEEGMKQTEVDQNIDKDSVDPKGSPGSPHYSEDFEEDEDEKQLEKQEEKPKLSPILAKVSLYDSLEDTREMDTKKTTAASLDKRQSYGQSGGSEMEALHEAYRQIHVVQDSEELNRTFVSSENKEENIHSTSPLHHHYRENRQSLQPASTNESDLLTAEELMRPIRPAEDHTRGFSLQPVSALDHTQDQVSGPQDLQSTFTDLPQKKRSSDEQKQLLSGWTTMSRPVLSPDASLPLFQEKTVSIREEVQRLMLDHESANKPSHNQTNRAKKQQIPSRTSAVPHSSSSRRPTVAPVRGRSMEAKTTLTSSVPGQNHRQNKATKTSVSQLRGTTLTRGPEKQKNQHYSEPDSKVSSDLVASVQSLVSVLQQQIDSRHFQDPATTHPETVIAQHSPNRQKEDDSLVVEELKSLLLEKERQLQKLKQESEELNSLKQHNYLLQSKLRSAEEAVQKNKWTGATDSTQNEKLQQMEKEMKEMETLIKGYQQENEKLYHQMKAQQAKSKANEEAMFNENQRLLSELAFTREQLSATQRPVSSVCSMDHTHRITQLLAQINMFQRNEAKLSEELHHLKQDKQALEVDLQLMKKERDLATKQATSVSGDKICELRVMEERHREEVSSLKKKLQWFAENQELLDRDAARLKAATAEIHQLTEQVEKLKMEVTKRSNKQQKKSRERSADTKKIQHLERQVKELEKILRSRNPNSLPALILAAASVPDPSHSLDPSSPAPPPSRVTVLLERRVQRLEAELEAHDEEAKRNLRAMEQQFQAIRMRYEQQISELEQQLQQKRQTEVLTETEPNQVQGLEEDLRREREAHRLKETELQGHISDLQQQIKLKAHSSPSRHQRQAEAAFGVRIERLNQELSIKTKTIQDLTRTVERLQKERRNMLSVHHMRPSDGHVGRGNETRRQTVSKQGPVTVHEEESKEEFPAAQCDKTYQPTVFTDCHISEVLQENESLKQCLQQIQTDSEQKNLEIKHQLTQALEDINRLKEEHSQQLSSVKSEHLKLEQQLRSAFALEHSSSTVAELTNQLHTQEILVKHLQEQLRELQSCRDALAISKTREDALQKQMSRLLQDLKEARDSQNPEVKLLWSLEKKIFNMEQRHQHRERELQQVIGGVFPDVDLQTEMERWKHVAQDKIREVECFRLELDSILDIIRHLQKQGVVLPAADPQFTVTHTR